MSGPKVVRIVTREELIEICKDHLARLDAALRRWEKVGVRNEVLDGHDIEAVRNRRAELQALLTADRFAELQKQVPDEIAYLQADMAQRLSEAASKAARGRVYGRRLATMAQHALDRAARGELALPERLRKDLEVVVTENGQDRVRAEMALSETLATSLGTASAPTLTSEQRALAERLGGGAQGDNLDQWVKDNLTETESDSIQVGKEIAELVLAGATTLAAGFAERQRVIDTEPSPSRRQMLADTLMLEVGKALADRRAKTEQLRALETNAAPLSSLGSAEAKELARKVAVAVAEENTEAAGGLLAEATALIAAERKKTAAKAQRSAILTALKDLGYEIREGLETAVPKDGRVVLRRATNPDMGVQITGMQAAERLQFRPVRFGEENSINDCSKDRDIETIWCSDFERLSGKIGASKGAVKVEKARAVGEEPVLFVSDAQSSAERRPEARTPAKTRTFNS